MTSIVCPPASLDRIVTWCETRGLKLDSVRSLGTGGGPVPDTLLARSTAVFSSCDPEVLYGSSEVEPVSHIAWSELKTLSGDGACVGRPVPEAKVRLADHGEVVVSGPHVSPRYFEDPAAMAATKIVENGTVWHRMGDLARVDEAGRLWLTGRVHTLLQTGDGPVLPLPLERALEKQAFVAAAAVVSVEGKAVAAVQPKSWEPGSFAAWKEALLAPPLSDVRFLRAIPRDPRHRSKIDYTRLRAILAPAAVPAKDTRAFPIRFVRYVMERYPPVPAAMLAALWALGAFAVAGGAPSPARISAGGAVVFLFLLALRLADERKDARRDAELHPERPVPRGLVTLRELAPVEAAVWLMQGATAGALGSHALVAWVALLAYGLLMRVEFFAGETLESRPFLYAITHQPVVLVLNAFLLVAAGVAPRDLLSAPLLLYQAATLAAMFAYEVSRKLRAPEDEDPRDTTYGAVHGPALPAVVAGVLAVAAAMALARLLDPWWSGAALLALPAVAFAARPTRSFAKAGAAAGTLLLIVIHGAVALSGMIAT